MKNTYWRLHPCPLSTTRRPTADTEQRTLHFSPRSLLLDLAHVSGASLLPLASSLASLSHALQRGDHMLLCITSPLFLGRQPYSGTGSGVLIFGLFFLLQLLDPQPLTQFGCTAQETKFYFVLAGIWLSLCLFGRHWDFHARDEKENRGGTHDARYLAKYVLSHMSQDTAWLALLYSTKMRNKILADKEFITKCRRVPCSLVD